MAAALVYLALAPVSLLFSFGFGLWLQIRFSQRPSVYCAATLLVGTILFLIFVRIANALMVWDCGPFSGKPEHLQWCFWFAAP